MALSLGLIWVLWTLQDPSWACWPKLGSDNVKCPLDLQMRELEDDLERRRPDSRSHPYGVPQLLGSVAGLRIDNLVQDGDGLLERPLQQLEAIVVRPRSLQVVPGNFLPTANVVQACGVQN